MSNISISLFNKQASARYPCKKIIVPVFCRCMIAARGLAAISGDLVRRLIPGNVTDTITEPIAEIL